MDSVHSVFCGQYEAAVMLTRWTGPEAFRISMHVVYRELVGRAITCLLSQADPRRELVSSHPPAPSDLARRTTWLNRLHTYSQPPPVGDAVCSIWCWPSERVLFDMAREVFTGVQSHHGPSDRGNPYAAYVLLPNGYYVWSPRLSNQQGREIILQLDDAAFVGRQLPPLPETAPRRLGDPLTGVPPPRDLPPPQPWELAPEGGIPAMLRERMERVETAGRAGPSPSAPKARISLDLAQRLSWPQRQAAGGASQGSTGAGGNPAAQVAALPLPPPPPRPDSPPRCAQEQPDRGARKRNRSPEASEGDQGRHRRSPRRNEAGSGEEQLPLALTWPAQEEQGVEEQQAQKEQPEEQLDAVELADTYFDSIYEGHRWQDDAEPAEAPAAQQDGTAGQEAPAEAPVGRKTRRGCRAGRNKRRRNQAGLGQQHQGRGQAQGYVGDGGMQHGSAAWQAGRAPGPGVGIGWQDGSAAWQAGRAPGDGVGGAWWDAEAAAYGGYGMEQAAAHHGGRATSPSAWRRGEAAP